MSRPRPPLFLARRSYRLRRMRDAARLLPLLGLFLVFMPILWGSGETSARDTAADAIFLFAVWAGLVLVAALMARGLNVSADDDSAGSEDGG